MKLNGKRGHEIWIVWQLNPLMSGDDDNISPSTNVSTESYSERIVAYVVQQRQRV